MSFCRVPSEVARHTSGGRLEMRHNRWFGSLLIIIASFSFPSRAQISDPASGASFPQISNRGLNDTTPGTGWIVGTVKTADGKPIDGGVVELYGGAAAPIVIHTSADGSFKIDNVPMGGHEVVARWNLFEATQQVSVTPGMNSINIILPGNSTATLEGGAVSRAQLALPKNTRHQLQKAELALRHNKLAKAAESVDKILVAQPQCAQALLLRAVIEREQNTPQLASADAEQSIIYDPNDPLAYFTLGSIYNDLNRYDDAIRTLDRGTKIGSNYWQGYYEMSRALLLKGDLTAALRQSDKASALAPPQFASLHLVKGYIYRGLNNPQECRRELELFIQLRPDSVAATRARATLSQLPTAEHDALPHGGASTSPVPVISNTPSHNQ